MSRIAQRQAGFTLIELIVALGIASLVSVLLLGGYSFASRAWNRADAMDDATSDIYAAQSMLRRAFTGLSLDSSKVQFSGNSAALGFITLFALPGDAPEPTAMGLSVDACPDGQCLMLVLSRPDWAGGKGQPMLRTPLIRGIDGAAIAYRGAGNNAPWQAVWPTDNGAPALVRIDVSFAGNRTRHWPTLYLAPPRAG